MIPGPEYATTPGAVAHVYTARVQVRHHELDAFGRVHAAVYLRYLAQAAVEASTAVGFDADWYAAAGTLWLVRRSTFEVGRPARAGERLEIRTWVEDFRRVRSHRRYEIRDPHAALCLTALTDWVYVAAATGRPRRVPAQMEGAFGLDGARARERPPWRAPAPPAAPARAVHRVGYAELDSLGHMNNAAYLDVCTQAALDALGDVGWSLDRVLASGAVPELRAGDIEYLEAARYGDYLETLTWFAPVAGGLEAHQDVARVADGRPLVRATTRLCWADVGSGLRVDWPPGLLAALRPLLAA